MDDREILDQLKKLDPAEREIIQNFIEFLVVKRELKNLETSFVSKQDENPGSHSNLFLIKGTLEEIDKE